jgi:SAM-dependent MidA family methyltransferase
MTHDAPMPVPAPAAAARASTELPEPSPEALAHSQHLLATVQRTIDAAGGWIPFSQYMDLALYAPALGYYSAGARKLGAAGDFTTAPEMTPLFGQTLAQVIAPLIRAGLPAILEIGAGSGALAASLLAELERIDALPASYQILEVSADLRERERDMLEKAVPHLIERVTWLNGLPPGFEGVVIGNEVLDAMPVERVRLAADGTLLRAGVSRRAGGPLTLADSPRGDLQIEYRPFDANTPEALRTSAESIAQRLGPLAIDYTSEIGLAASGFVQALASHLARAVCLFVDYGFPAAEFYHPQRSEGTLMCHYRHRSHDDPLRWPGLQDITAHVDFTAVADAADAAGCTLLGYSSQAHFLIAGGLTELLARTPADDPAHYLPQSNAVQRLVSPAEMGELFKVIGFARGWDAPLPAFAVGNRLARLG